MDERQANGVDGAMAGIVRPAKGDPRPASASRPSPAPGSCGLWRGLPGMERAAAIDERWHASMGEFDRLVAGISPHVGWPSPAERHRAVATLLLCAVHPEHERQLERRLERAARPPGASCGGRSWRPRASATRRPPRWRC